jgi:glycosyltransferase involved in cell wall biosynthesis
MGPEFGGGSMLSRTVAVLPAFNEEIAIGSMVLLVKKYVDRVIVVDDGSHDRTTCVAT